jgi:hypothetical protein
MGSSEGQTYCLRWNNHKSNLVEILDALIKMESYVDCTIYVDDRVQFKAHRVVLAANSPYFQTILQGVPMDHCTILFPEVKAFEMRALLEYMYTGEVNVTQSQIPRIMKIARDLEVKGLYDMADLKDLKDDQSHTFTSLSNSTTKANNHHHNHTTLSNTSHSNNINNHNQHNIHHQHNQSSPIITTSTNITQAQSSSSSPPYSYKSPYSSLYARSPVPTSSDRLPQWPPHLPQTIPSQHLQNAAAAMLSSVYDSGSDMNPLKRKKLSSISSMLMSRDTPILRNVLAQPNAADSSQPVPLVCQSVDNDRSDRHSGHSNGTDYSDKKVKYEEAHSPYTDKSFDDEPLDHSQSYSGSDSRIASYVPQQKPEWKRYKQYTRNDILSAIDCVRNGMSALQASRKFGVPSRTLYDKVKKLGITTGRPMNRSIKRSPSHGGSPAGFPYGITGTSSPYGHHNQENHPSQSQNDNDRDHIPPTIPHPAAALLDATFLQQALEARGGDIAGREALHAMAFAAAAHAAVNGISTSPGTHGTARSPSPGILMKYIRPSTPSPTPEKLDDSDHVEDLSMSKRDSDRSITPLSGSHTPPSPPASVTQTHQSIPQQFGVIVPPMTKVTTPKDDFKEFKDIKRELIATEDDSRE